MIKYVPKTWGHEEWLVNEPLYCLKKLVVLPGFWCGFHYHIKKTESFYITSGTLRLSLLTGMNEKGESSLLKAPDNPTAEDIDKLLEHSQLVMFHENIPLEKGCQIKIDPLTIHSFTPFDDKPVEFFEVSTHHDDNDSIRIRH